MKWHGFPCRFAGEYDSQNTSVTRGTSMGSIDLQRSDRLPARYERAPGEFCIEGYRDRAVNIEMPGVIEDCGFGGLPASDVSQQVGATSRSWRPGSREPDIDFQNLPVTGLAQLSEPLSQARSEYRPTKICYFTSHRSLSLHDDVQCGSTTPMSCAIVWTIHSRQGHRGFPSV